MNRIVFVALTVALAACNSTTKTDGATPTPQNKLVLTGSSTVAPLAAEIGKRFEKKHPGLHVDVQTGGSSRGVSDAQGGLADIGDVSRDLKPEEKAQGLVATGIALDGICMIVHKDNPIKALTNEQVVKIYKGEITDWKDVGGKKAPITVINKDEGRSTLELFTKFYGLETKDIKASAVIGDNEQGIKTVAGNPNAIGYVSIGTAEFDQKNGTAIKLLPMGGVEASVENVKSGKFPLSRPLNLVTRGAPAGLAREFIEYAKSSEVQDIVKDQFFVSIVPGL